MSQRRSITEWMAEGFQPEPGMPEKVSLLRWKLSCKAKQEWIETLWAGLPVMRARLQLLAHALRQEAVGEPDAGNLHVRFDEEALENLVLYGPK